MPVQIQLDKLPEAIRNLAESQIPFATSLTMNRAFQHGINGVKTAMDQGGIEGGPVRFTKQGVSYIASSKRSLRGAIYFKGDREYMREVIFGGTRRGRGNSRIPEPNKKSKVKTVNKRGNYPRNWLQQRMMIAAAKADTNFPAPSLRKGMKGSDFGLGRTKRGKFGLFKFVGKGKSRKPKLLVYLSRKSRRQRATFPQAPDVAQENFMQSFDRNFGPNFQDIVQKEFHRIAGR